MKWAKHALILGVFVLLTTACTQIIPMIALTMETEQGISADFPFQANFVNVNGSRMFYVDEGSKSAPVVVLLHGNPTSSYLWRNIIPTLAKTHRVIAPDLIGMGKSDKPNIPYTLQNHQDYFNGFMRELDIPKAALVLHDWGGAIGTNYARLYPKNVTSIVMMEAVLRPMNWDEADMIATYLFKAFRDKQKGDELIIENNYFVEKLLPMMAGRSLSEAEMNAYRQPYLTLSDRQPIRQWPLEIPIDGAPARNVEAVQANYTFITKTKIPLHFVYAEPGMIFNKDFVSQLKLAIPHAEYTYIGEGLHYLQENKPTLIANTLSVWLNQQLRKD